MHFSSKISSSTSLTRQEHISSDSLPVSVDERRGKLTRAFIAHATRVVDDFHFVAETGYVAIKVIQCDPADKRAALSLIGRRADAKFILVAHGDKTFYMLRL
jgi:hypothetical protein